MNKLYLTLLLWLAAAIANGANTPQGTLSNIMQALQHNSGKNVQEKVYVHTDNTCYFIGDTLWYKAYVVRADDLRPTDMSRILYVELLNPDGLVVERQNLVVDPRGNYSCGSFVLQDSLYSGFYELRAYTRYMLNFNVSEHRYGREIKYNFFNANMAKDFFRQWDGLYSRVLPIYKKPDEQGDFTYKRMYNRPKQRVVPAEKDKLLATFFPEGGHLVKGIVNRVAFELTTQEGEAVNLQGEVTKEDKPMAKIHTQHMGRGVFSIVPSDERLKATFTYHGKEYSFKLPEAETAGATVRMADGKAIFTARQLPHDRQYGVSILCRGVLRHVCEARFDSHGTFTLSLPQLPTGVNDITLFDSDGQILADRLFFINNHDNDGYTALVDSGMKLTYSPYEPVTLGIRCQKVDTAALLSVSVRDKQTDEPSYDDGDIMTDLLLSSELKGFVAHPAYYFEADDAQHREHLDLLMMVQGWRKYDWKSLAGQQPMALRYAPEKTMTVEGGVYKTDSPYEVQPTEIGMWKFGIGRIGLDEGNDDTTDDTGTDSSDDAADSGSGDEQQEGTETVSAEDVLSEITPAEGRNEYGLLRDEQKLRRKSRGPLKKEVLVEAELIVGKDVAGITQKTSDGGRYLIQIPPFYGCGVLNMKAYSVKDSLKKNMMTGSLKGSLNEEDDPDFFVKRDLFFPRFTHPYGYYQNHTPDLVTPLDTISELSMENDNHLLRNINVKGRWHGKRSIDYAKPAFVTDAYEIYNDLTDYGLSNGYFSMRSFPIQVCMYLYGNMGRYIQYNVDGRLDNENYSNYIFYRNYSTGRPTWSVNSNKSDYDLEQQLKLKRISDISVYSDFEPRNEDAKIEYTRYTADATVVFHSFPNNAEQPTFRDRHIILQGFDYPQKFYSPDYSQRQPQAPTDYRRTLYWNPNLKTDGKGRATVSFFNNSRETRISVSVSGITADGRLIRTQPK